jgi:hypothetical protein
VSIVANPSFEDPLGPLLTVPPQPLYFGGWSPFQGFNAAPHQPTRVTSDKHSGSYGLHITGDEQLTLGLDYDRGPGTAAGFLTVNLQPTDSVFTAWGATMTGPPLTYGLWHQGMRSFPDGAAELEFDGVVVLSHGPQIVPAFSVATILVGEGAGVFTPYTDDFYWDDVALDWAPYPATSGWALGGMAIA